MLLLGDSVAIEVLAMVVLVTDGTIIIDDELAAATALVGLNNSGGRVCGETTILLETASSKTSWTKINCSKV